MNSTTNNPHRTDDNDRILRSPSALLTNIERQRKFLLQRASIPHSCPACATRQTMIEASIHALGDLNKYDAGYHKSEDFACTNCKRRLVHYLTIFGEEGFYLSIEETAKLDPITAQGFADSTEVLKLIAQVNLKAPGILARFEAWKATDGSKAGLEAIIAAGREPPRAKGGA
jgi:hypothetical protein